MDTHIKVLGFLYIIAGAILIVLGLLFLGIIGAVSASQHMFSMGGVIGTAVAAFFVILSIPSIIAGVGLLKRREWARILTIVLGVLHLFGFPVGTALGIYTLYVLFNDQTKPLFA